MPKEAGNISKAVLIIRAPSDSGILPMTPAQLTVAALTGNNPTQKTQLREQTIEVQYNPSTLTIQANAEAIPYTSLLKNECDNIPNQNTRNPTVVLGVELYFDATNPHEAFMADKFSPSLGGVVSAASSAKHGPHSVLPQTAAMLALPMREESKDVTFRWGSMSFTGVVSEVQAEYTMFSISGRPIRSRVYMHISQTLNTKGEEQYWENVIEKMFKKQDPSKMKTHLINSQLH